MSISKIEKKNKGKDDLETAAFIYNDSKINYYTFASSLHENH